MLTITRIMRSLGNEGAVSNVRSQLDRHKRDAWLVANLTLRLDQQDRAAAELAIRASAA